MGWTNSHLHSFRIGNDYLGPIDAEGVNDDWYDEDSAILSDLVADDRRRMIYEYDFGDGWEHDILISKPKSPKPGVFYPRCIKGELACPPEDCGGVWGYMELCELLNMPKAEWNDDQTAQMEWLGDFDPQAFSVNEVNQAFQEMFAPPEPPKKKPKQK